LIRMLDQAQRHANGEGVAAVRLQYLPHNTGLGATPLEALVLGPEPGWRLPPEVNDFSNTEIGGLHVRLRRLAPWLHTTQSVNSAAATNGDIATIALTARDVVGPTLVSFTNFRIGTNHGRAFVAVADEDQRLAVLNPETDMPDAGAWTSVADAGKVPRNTNVLRYTPAGTTESLSEEGIINTLLLSDARLLGVYANVRNNSATTSFLLRAQIIENLYTVYTPQVAIPANATNPKWYPLGLVRTTTEPTGARLAATASAASGSLDIDSLVFVDFTTGRAFVIELNTRDGSSASLSVSLTLDHAMLTEPAPLVYISSNYGWPRSSDVAIFTRGSAIRCLLMGVGGSGAADRWRQETGAAAITNVWTATRHTAYLAPE
jgi:hypothetical protein